MKKIINNDKDISRRLRTDPAQLMLNYIENSKKTSSLVETFIIAEHQEVFQHLMMIMNKIPAKSATSISKLAAHVDMLYCFKDILGATFTTLQQ